MSNNNIYIIKKSNIHGNGVFANKNIKNKELIEIAILIKPNTQPANKLLKPQPTFYYQITPYFGSLINHSKTKDNIELFFIDNKYYARANKNILKGTEICANYDGHTIPPFIQGSLPHYID